MISVEQYPDTGYFLVATTSSTELGSYVIGAGDLSFVNFRCFHRKVGAFSYTMQLIVSTTAGGPALATSDSFTFDNTSIVQTTDDHLVDISLNFSDNYTFLATESYFFRLVATGYSRPSTPNENTAYLAIWCDWYDPLGTSNTGGARLAIGVKR